MKYALIALLLGFTPIGASAQTSNCYLDGGISWARLYPGASVTYNYNVVRYVGIGVGVQAYDFHFVRPSFQVIPALYGELRANICPRKEKQFSVFFDLGVNFYAREDDTWIDDNVRYTVAKNNGTYAGLGVSYAWGTGTNYFKYFVSLKMISNNYSANGTDLGSGAQSTSGWGDQTLVTSFGLKF